MCRLWFSRLGEWSEAQGANGEICNYLLPEKSSRKRRLRRILSGNCHAGALPGVENLQNSSSGGDIAAMPPQPLDDLRVCIRWRTAECLRKQAESVKVIMPVTHHGPACLRHPPLVCNRLQCCALAVAIIRQSHIAPCPLGSHPGKPGDEVPEEGHDGIHRG